MIENIEYYEKLIKMMRDDEEIFGLVREDRERIYEWQRKIQGLKK